MNTHWFTADKEKIQARNLFFLLQFFDECLGCDSFFI
ncbi:hypothetical protein BvCmsHHNP001_02358 [Escherichia coli]|nr:hypothetical protein BvCmsHHNP001_02358 [Escherichia coli]